MDQSVGDFFWTLNFKKKQFIMCIILLIEVKSAFHRCFYCFYRCVAIFTNPNLPKRLLL